LIHLVRSGDAPTFQLIQLISIVFNLNSKEQEKACQPFTPSTVPPFSRKHELVKLLLVMFGYYFGISYFG